MKYTIVEQITEGTELTKFIMRMLMELKLVDFEGFMTTTFHFSKTNQRLHGLMEIHDCLKHLGDPDYYGWFPCKICEKRFPPWVFNNEENQPSTWQLL